MPDSSGRFKGISVPELPWTPKQKVEMQRVTMAELDGKTQEEVVALLKQRVAVALAEKDALND